MLTRFKVLSTNYARLYDKINFTISVVPDYNEAMVDLDKVMKPGNEYELSVKELGKRRSSEANAYAWVLIGKLAKALKLKTTEVYRQYVLDMFTFRDVLVKDEDFEKEKQEWKKDHLGRDLIKLGDCKDHEGWVWCRKFRSSSDYDTTEMSRFIDLLVYDCYDQGIDVERTQDEIEQMKASWK